MRNNRGYTLIELMVAAGLFAVIMLLASGAYLVMIGLNRHAQGIATGIDNLSFALETMTRDIRTGSGYCLTTACTLTSFSFRNKDGTETTYALGSQLGASGQVGSITKNTLALTDPAVGITSLAFYRYGTEPYSLNGETEQARVTIVISGVVYSSANKTPQYFSIETLATMRQSDI